MFTFLTQPDPIRWFSLTGSLAAVIGCLVTGWAYRGKNGERYSLLNHFISELGERGVSRLAWVFNASLVLCGALIFLASLGLGLQIPGWLSKLGLVAGCVTAVGVALVGVYPMNNLIPHTRAAMTYFRGGLVMILLFSAAILAQPAGQRVLPVVVGLLGIPAVAAYASFLIYMNRTPGSSSQALEASFTRRPRVWLMALLEWLVFLTTIPWFFAVALGL